MHFSKLCDVVEFFILVPSGFYLAYLFAPVKSEEQYAQVINLLGLGLDFIGVMLLSEKFLKIPSKLKVLKELVLGAVLATPWMLSIGWVLYEVLAILLDLPTSQIWQDALSIVVIYVGITLYGFESIADALGAKFMSDTKIRIAYYGWFMFLSGLSMQIYAALIELNIA